MYFHRLICDNDTVSIQKNSDEDKSVIIELHDSCFDVPFASDTMDMPSVKGAHKFVMYFEDNPVGMFWCHELTAETVFVTSLCVHPDHRRKGYGRKLINIIRTVCANIDTVITQAPANCQEFCKNTGCLYLTDLGNDVSLWVIKKRY